MRPINRRLWLKTLLAAAAAPSPHAAAAPQARALHVHDQIRKQAAEAPLRMLFGGSTPEQCREWQQRFRAQLAELLGPCKPPSHWETTVEEVVEFDDHRRETLILSADSHPSLPLYVLTPKGDRPAPRPAVLTLHGHGPFGADPVVGLDSTPELKENIEKSNYGYGLELVRRGYVVAAPFFQPFGRRLDDPEAYGGDDACAVSFVRMQLLGKLLIAENLRDALWAFELLARRTEVDSGRIGCVGLSYGGRMTMLTAAMEPRIRLAVVSGALNLMQERIAQRYSCGAQVIPHLLEYGDVPEIASLIAPRPILWEVGQRDSLMVKDWIPRAWERIRRAYQAFGAEERLAMDSFDGPHRWNGIEAYPFLAAVLRP